MNLELLLRHFDRISDAPNAIPRLRRFILELAMRGKLVAQSANEEPATELLKRIRARKIQLFAGNSLKKQGELPSIRNADTPFELPESWIWIRVADGFMYDAGTKREPRDLVSDRWLLELEDIEKNTSRLLVRLKVRDRNSKSTKSEFQAGDILYGKLRPYLNKVVIADECGYSTTEIVSIRPYVPMCSAYCALAFRRPDFVEYVTSLGRGTKMPRLRTPDALTALFPLAPLAEQHRIVAKVDELMALCNQLEEARAERESRCEHLTAASYYHLGNSADADDRHKHARFYMGHLPKLTTRLDQIKQLRETILNLAVRGQLVPQDSREENASVLEKRLKAEINAYAIAQGIAAPKPDAIKSEILPRLAPKGWIWTRLCNLFKVITDGDHQPPPKAETGIAFLTIGNITTGRLNFSGCRFVPQWYWDDLPNYRKPSYGDILYIVVGATYGRPAFVETDRPFCVQRHIAILKPANEIPVRFLVLLLASPLVYEQATKSTTGTAQPTIPLRPLRNFMVLLPPLAEQHRIVSKVDELMALCDCLEEQIASADTYKEHLLESILDRALNNNLDVGETIDQIQNWTDTADSSLQRSLDVAR